jgi:long-chain acyl-CoA synthetase
MNTIFHRFQDIATRSSNDTFVGDIVGDTIVRQSYSQILDKVRCLAGYLQAAGLRQGDRVAILVPNSADWIIADLACAQLGLIDVPIHTTYSWNYIHFTIKHSGATVLIVDAAPWQRYQADIVALGLQRIIVRGQAEVVAPAVSWQVCLSSPPFF